MAYKWLVKRWDTFFSAVAQAETEEQVKALCESEIQAWRDRPGMKQESSLKVPMNDSRNEAQRRLQGERLAWVMSHLAFSREWYIKHNAPSQANLADRLEHQQLLRDPDAIVTKGDALLNSDYWPDVFVGLLVTTGRRPLELYDQGSFEYKTDYSVLFSGQAKRRGDPLPAYEIPTLCKAQRAIDALAKARAQIDTTGLDAAAITRKYSPLVKEAANKHFADLVPVRHSERSRKTDPDDEQGLYGQLFRAVYPRIAVFWFCPPTIDDRHYMATIQGHRKHFEGLASEEERLSYSSGAHYSDYKIADAQGNIDGRQGLRLGAKGVELLEVFKPKRRKEPMTMTTDQAQEQKQEGRNVPVTVDRTTFNRVQALRSGKGHRTYSETVSLLLDTYEQGGQAAPFSVGESLRSLLATDESYKKLSQEEETAEAAAMLDKMLADREGYQALVIDALIKEAKFRVGLEKRHEGKDFSQLTLAQLAKTRDPRATNERIRRAILAVAAYNDDPARAQTEKWYINATTIHRLVGGRYPIIGAYIKEHQAEIDALNGKYELNDRYNSKPYYVDSVVSVPDEPPAQEAQAQEDAAPATDQAQQPESEATA